MTKIGRPWKRCLTRECRRAIRWAPVLCMECYVAPAPLRPHLRAVAKVRIGEHIHDKDRRAE